MDDSTQRVNLNRTLPSFGALVCKFFRRLTLQEPTLSEVVVVYTELPSARDDGSGNAGGSAAVGGGGGGEGGSVLRLKSFRDIPLADVEVVLPGLKVDRMKSADIVKLVVILLAGIATALYSFFFATSGEKWVLRITLLSLLCSC